MPEIFFRFAETNRIMNKKLIAVAMIFSSMAAISQVRMPQPSPTQTLHQDFGLGKIELTYSRPSIKERTLFTPNSELAPFGQVWRTGANNATKIRFTDLVQINGNKLDTGTYALYTIPGATEWTIIINKGLKWGTEYKQEEDIFRFTVPSKTIANKHESFTMQFSDIKPESCNLDLMWGNTNVSVPITTNVRDRIRTQLETALNATEKRPGLHYNAANFYYEYDKDYAKALAYADKAIEENKEAFWVYLLKARIQKAAGDKSGAKATAQITIDKATAQKNDDYARFARELIKSL
jgi:hypothetical protein